MKILHVATHLNTGGITSYLLALVREQRKAGHEVYVWASTGNCLEDFSVCVTQVIPDVPRCKSELSPRLWMQLPRLIRFLSTHSIDIIHTHTRVAQVLSAAATCFVKIPCISTAHMVYKRRLGRRFFPCWGRTVIAISKMMEQEIAKVFGRENLPPVVVVSNGIDIEALRAKVEKTDRTETRKTYGYGKDHVVILSLCRLIPVKGVHVLIDAFAVAQKQIPEIRLLIAGVGDETYLEELKDQVLRLGVQEQVHFIGNIKETEKPLRAADIFVGPYLWPEPFGLSVLEAMTAGLPVIGSRSGGISELLDNGKRGLLFQEGNISELTEHLIRYAKDPDFRARMAHVGQEAALKEYSSQKMAQGIQKVYEDVLGQRI